MTLDEAVRFLAGSHQWVTLALLFLSAIIEYVFPPFPGDTVTLAGAVLVTAHGYSPTGVFLAVLAGGVVGSAADYGAGVLVARGAHSRLMRFGIVRQAIEGAEKVSRAFARHGEAFIVVNRFLPGIRAFLFVAAGMAGMRFWRVMFFATLSGIAWNLLVIAAGAAVGSNLDELETLFARYSAVAWTAVCVVAALLVVRWLRNRSRRARAGRD